MTSIVDRIIAYESGTLQEEEVYAFFQELLDTGAINHLQGSYHRTAIDLLNAQAIRPPVRTGWHCDTGFEHDGTALEVVEYEEDELGNDTNVPCRDYLGQDMRGKLADMPASAVKWVCLSKGEALRYGTADDLYRVCFDEVIGNDGEGGYLVVVRKEHASDQATQAEEGE